ncbi:hypothetical protein [Staphylococcus pasteuri_A]|uniref:PepSY domain-containing protein n=1 Tax=Staphylococcus pasteuri_A TaxID=3062664 RepID=A0AAW7YSB5_9STAP|nr:hypothetical protein [Staphylococcus pasteuri_A]MDO6575155.1 hypothetical protein [Staphylococcus pasteuri_A]
MPKWIVTTDDGISTVEEADLPHVAARQATDAVHVDYLYRDDHGRFVYTLFDQDGTNYGDLTVEPEVDE